MLARKGKDKRVGVVFLLHHPASASQLRSTCSSRKEDGYFALSSDCRIVSNLWELVEAHDNMETNVSFQLLNARLPCDLCLCSSQALSSVNFCLLNNLGKVGVIEEVREHIQWVTTDGNTRPNWRCTWL